MTSVRSLSKMTMNANSTPGQRIASAWRLPLLAWLALHLCASAPAQEWHWAPGTYTSKDPLTADITGVAAGSGGEFRFVNTAGKFASADSTGMAWTERANVGELRDVFFDGSTYLVCGVDGAILRGPAGLTPLDKGSYTLNGITTSGSRIVAVGNNGDIRYQDGTAWKNGTFVNLNNSQKSATRFGVAYGANRFVAVGAGGVVLWSDNGATWNLSTGTGSKKLNAIHWANNRNSFIAVGDEGAVVYSSDGKTFKPGNSPAADKPNLNGVTFGTVAQQAYFVAVSAGGEVFAATAPDGSWTKVGNNLGTGSQGGGLRDVAINANGVVVAVGNGGGIRVSSGPLNPRADFKPPGPVNHSAAAVKAASVVVEASPANVSWEWEATVADNPGKFLTLLDTTSAGKVVKTGNFNLRYDLAANIAEARTARIEIRQKGGTTVLASLEVKQLATDEIRLSTTKQSVGGAAGHYTLTVTPVPAFVWKAVITTPQDGLTVNPATWSGQQSVTVNYGSYTSASGSRQATIQFLRASDNKVMAEHTLTQSGLAPPAAAAWGWAPRNLGNGAGWVAVQAGTKGWLAHGEAGRVDFSTSGEVGWRPTISAAAGTREPGGAYFDGNSYVTVGDGLLIHFSANPEAPEAEWSRKFSKGWQGWADGRLSDIAFNGQRYVAVGRVTTSSERQFEELILTSAIGGDNWSRVNLNPNADTNTLFGVATYPNGPFVAVGSNGKIRYSLLDGTTWTKKDVGGTDFRGVAYGAGRFVAVGLKGKVQYSDDSGVNWKTDVVGVAVGKDLRAITYGKAGDGVAYFVAVGNGVIQSSVDGVSWFEASTEALDLTDIEYRQFPDGTGLFVGVGANGAFYSSRGPATGVAFSTPATQPSGNSALEVAITTTSGSWTAYSPDSWITLENGGGKSGDKLRMTIAALPDGTQSQRTGTVVFNNGTPTSGTRMTIRQNPVARFGADMVREFSLTGGGGVTLTADVSVFPSTTDWRVSAGSVPSWLGVARIPSTSKLQFTTLSENTTTAPRVATLAVVYTEGDRETPIGTLTVQQLPKAVVPKENWGWVDITPSNLYSKATKQNVNAQEWITGTWNAVTHGGRKWVAVSESGRVATADRLDAGTRWTLQDVDSQQTFRDVVWDGSQFGIVGSRRVRFSQDDSASSFLAPVADGENLRFESITYNAGRYVTVGESIETGKAVIFGADGSAVAKWKNQNISTGNKLWAVEYGATRFVAVGQNGVVMHSPTGHGRDWEVVPAANRQNPNNHTLRALNYNGRQFLAVGAGGTVSRSTDGTSWTTASPAVGIPSDVVLKGVTFGAGFYLAIGETANDRAVPIYSSLDGSYWTEASVDRYKLRSISYEVSDYPCSLVPGVFVAVGEQGKLIVSYGPGNYSTLTGPVPPEAPLGSGEASAGSFYVTALAPWKATLSDAGSGVNWLRLKYPNGTPCQAIEFEAASANLGDQPRMVDIVVSTTAGVTPLTVRVTQAAGQAEYDVAPDSRRVAQKGAEFELLFTSSRTGVQWTVAARNSPWLEVGARNQTTGKVKITAKPQPIKDCRVGYLDFLVNEVVVKTVKIIQFGTDGRCTECETKDLVAK